MAEINNREKMLRIMLFLPLESHCKMYNIVAQLISLT